MSMLMTIVNWLLCFFGMHSWIEWYEPKHKVRMRKCVRCKKHQFLYEEKYFQKVGGSEPIREWVNWDVKDILK